MRCFELINLYNYPSKEKIKEECESFGYENYIPYDLFADLLTWCVGDYLNLDLKIILNTKQANLRLEFFQTLNSFLMRDSTPIKSAIKLLTYLESNYNLRELEAGVMDKGEFFNFKQDLEEEELYEFLSIMPKSCSNKYQLNKVLNLSYSIINNNNSFSEKDVEYIRIKAIKDVLKVKKSKWVHPDFLDKLVKKEHIISTETINKGSEKVIIYLEDQTTSMLENIELLMASRYALLKLCNKTVHFYPFNYSLQECTVLSNKEDMINIFRQPIKFAQIESNYFNVLNKLQSIYNTGSVFLVTDTENSIPRSLDKKLKINCITNRYNKQMKDLVNHTKGKYIKI
jgi:hypothetical protein